jgi:hypothetical protein
MWSNGRVRNAPTISSSPAQIRDTSLRDPRVDTQRGDEVIDRTRRDASDVGLHHHRVERLVDPAARLQNRREEAAFAELGDAQLDIAGLGRQQAWAVTVAFGHTIVGTLITASADVLDRLGLDHLLQHQLHGIADQVHAVTGAERVQQIGHGRL